MGDWPALWPPVEWDASLGRARGGCEPALEEIVVVGKSDGDVVLASLGKPFGSRQESAIVSRNRIHGRHGDARQAGDRFARNWVAVFVESPQEVDGERGQRVGDRRPG